VNGALELEVEVPGISDERYRDRKQAGAEGNVRLLAKLAEAKIGWEFRRLGPWTTKFTINDRTYGGWFDAMHDPRVEQFTKLFPEAHNVLELGSLEGGHSLALAKRPRTSRVLALEARIENINRAKLVQRLFSAGNVTFVQANLEQSNIFRDYPNFDAVFCCGLLYHLVRPWELLGQISRVSNGLFLSTHYCLKDRASIMQESYEGIWYKEGGALDPLSGLSQKSFWPTLESLQSMLYNSGFKAVKLVETDEHHQNGPITTITAKK
jgi:ubiquinone/menaquinone biosynthesis C-methylase UbiE